MSEVAQNNVLPEGLTEENILQELGLKGLEPHAQITKLQKIFKNTGLDSDMYFLAKAIAKQREGRDNPTSEAIVEARKNLMQILKPRYNLLLQEVNSH